MARVLLKDVSKIYEKNVVAVNKANIDIQDKEFIVLVGPSGCGKSTTLRMVAGLEEISSGEIYIGERLVNEVQPKDRDIAMVFQNYALYPHMTVYENMAFGLRLRKFSKSEIDARVKEAAAILGIENLLERKPKALSGGQRQRVAVGRAIVRKPAVFLFDEPLSNLDAKLRVQMRTEISKLHNRLETTMMYVTHDQVEAMTMGDRICIMDHGRVAQIGAPLEVYHRPATTFVAGFLGSPPMNLLPATIADGVVHLGEAALALPGRAPEGPVTLGVRPEDLVPAPEGPLAGEVVAVEPLGAETILSVRLPGVERELILRAGRSAPAGLGERIALAASHDAIHLFDATTGHRLT